MFTSDTYKGSRGINISGFWDKQCFFQRYFCDLQTYVLNGFVFIVATH